MTIFTHAVYNPSKADLPPQSGVFPIIYAISLRGLGAHTKTGCALLTAAISGGAIFPVVMSPVANRRGIGYAFCVVLAVYAFGAVFPAYLNAVPAAKDQVDPARKGRRLAAPSPRSKRVSAVFRRNKTSADLPTTEHVEGNVGSLAPWPD